jgi:hypothetical protein
MLQLGAYNNIIFFPAILRKTQVLMSTYFKHDFNLGRSTYNELHGQDSSNYS